MSASAKPESTTVATRTKPALPAERQAHIEEIRARNQMVAAIRGTQWGANSSAELQRSIAEYCRQNNLDPVRHVEVLGGRIYLTSELYDEKGAHLLRSGEVVPDEPDYINADERLDKLAAAGDEWAKEETMRRMRLRIQYAVPEKSLAVVLQRFVLKSGAAIVGVNWCGGNGRRDPVGDAEPAKTAQTRARRRAWKQIADIIPGYAEIIRPIEASAKIVSEELPVSVIAAPSATKAITSGGYGDEPTTEVVVEEVTGELALGEERSAPTRRRTSMDADT